MYRTVPDQPLWTAHAADAAICVVGSGRSKGLVLQPCKRAQVVRCVSSRGFLPPLLPAPKPQRTWTLQHSSSVPPGCDGRGDHQKARICACFVEVGPCASRAGNTVRGTRDMGLLALCRGGAWGAGQFHLPVLPCHTHTHTHTHTLVVYHAVQYKQWVCTWSNCPSNLQVMQHILQRKPGPDTNTRNTQTGQLQQLVLWAHYNLGATKSSLSISGHLGVTSH